METPISTYKNNIRISFSAKPPMRDWIGWKPLQIQIGPAINAVVVAEVFLWEARNAKFVYDPSHGYF